MTLRGTHVQMDAVTSAWRFFFLTLAMHPSTSFSVSARLPGTTHHSAVRPLLAPSSFKTLFPSLGLPRKVSNWPKKSSIVRLHSVWKVQVVCLVLSSFKCCFDAQFTQGGEMANSGTLWCVCEKKVVWENQNSEIQMSLVWVSSQKWPCNPPHPAGKAPTPQSTASPPSSS